jgi:hypothetical protein
VRVAPRRVSSRATLSASPDATSTTSRGGKVLDCEDMDMYREINESGRARLLIFNPMSKNVQKQQGSRRDHCKINSLNICWLPDLVAESTAAPLFLRASWLSAQWSLRLGTEPSTSAATSSCLRLRGRPGLSDNALLVLSSCRATSISSSLGCSSRELFGLQLLCA